MTTLTLKVLAAPYGVGAENRTVTGQKFTIGRDPGCDLCLADPSRILSKNHCLIERRGDCWHLVDRSTNGTFVNQDTVPLCKASRELRNGDTIEIGGYKFEVLIGDDEPLTPIPVSSSHGLPSTRYDDERPLAGVFSSSQSEGTAGVADMGDVDFLGAQDVSINVHPRGDSAPAMHDPGVLSTPYVPPRVVSDVIGDDWDQDPESSESLSENPFEREEDSVGLLTDEQPREVIFPRETSPSGGQKHFSLRTGNEDQTSQEEEDHVTAESAGPVYLGQDSEHIFPEGQADLLKAFLHGAGLSGIQEQVFTPESMEELGRSFRATIHGLRQIMIARASIKGEFRIEQTMIQTSGNNPLKFSANDDDALLALIGVGRSSGMLPSRAISETLNDIRLHEFAVLRAMQEAIGGLLVRMEPARFREDAGSRFMDFCPDNQSGRAFRQFETQYKRTQDALNDDFDSVFGKAFARAYEKAIMKAEPVLRKTDPHETSGQNGGHP